MRRRLLRVGKLVLATVAVVYVSGCALLFSVQRKMVFPAPAEAQTPALEGGELLRIPRAASDGDGAADDVVAFFVPAAAGRRTVVHFHGNGEQLSDTVWLARRLTADGTGFCAIEYPGYGLAPGAPTEESLYAAAETALRALIAERGVRAEDVVIVGRSIGTGPATEMAARGFGRRLVLISPFTSLADVAAPAFPWLPVRLLLRDRFENAEKAPKIDVPVLIVHGTRDEVVPYALGQTLSTKFPHAAFFSVPGAAHNTILQSPGVMDRLGGFIRE